MLEERQLLDFARVVFGECDLLGCGGRSVPAGSVDQLARQAFPIERRSLAHARLFGETEKRDLLLEPSNVLAGPAGQAIESAFTRRRRPRSTT